MRLRRSKGVLTRRQWRGASACAAPFGLACRTVGHLFPLAAFVDRICRVCGSARQAALAASSDSDDDSSGSDHQTHFRPDSCLPPALAGNASHSFGCGPGDAERLARVRDMAVDGVGSVPGPSAVQVEPGEKRRATDGSGASSAERQKRKKKAADDAGPKRKRETKEKEGKKEKKEKKKERKKKDKKNPKTKKDKKDKHSHQ